jgi:hypothetical protein
MFGKGSGAQDGGKLGHNQGREGKAREDRDNMVGRTRFGRPPMRFGRPWLVSEGGPMRFGGVPWAWKVRALRRPVVLASVDGKRLLPMELHARWTEIKTRLPEFAETGPRLWGAKGGVFQMFFRAILGHGG